MSNQPHPNLSVRLKIALSWCLAWGQGHQPQFDISLLREMRQALLNHTTVPKPLASLVKQVEILEAIPTDAYPNNLEEFKNLAKDLWEQKTLIGLVYGGATKIKQYVFESANLMEIRGASAILDRINLIELPAFFKQTAPEFKDKQEQPIRDWLAKQPQTAELLEALIPELIIYSTGGNILAFCPAAYGNDLADLIEKRYTDETLTANSCAVSDSFRLLEFRFGLLSTEFEQTPWFDWYQTNIDSSLVSVYYGQPSDKSLDSLRRQFFDRKSFNELAGKMATLFNQRRSGNQTPGRLPRCYPPMLETHPYLRRDDNGQWSAIAQAERLPRTPYFSEPLARKYRTGQITKREDSSKNWLNQFGLDWTASDEKSWVRRFTDYLEDEKNANLKSQYYQGKNPLQVDETRSLEEIGNVSDGYITFIYADGNNMGGYIQKIKTPEEYAQFSEDIFEATAQSVYYALANHLHPHQLKKLSKPDSKKRENSWVHPFEIITIGGDDVLLIIPANKSLQIAKDIAEKFEEILAAKGDRYRIPAEQKITDIKKAHRFSGDLPIKFANSCLSTSLGVLTIAYDTPIYYADKLVGQLLKSAKKGVKEVTRRYREACPSAKNQTYFGSTIDILTLKSVTMVSSNIQEFREEGLTIQRKDSPKLKLYASPYTPHELGGLIQTIQKFKEADFPRSQLYQIRELLKQGKRTTMLNYHYFRTRLKPDKSKLLKKYFEQAWCLPKDETNYGSLAPWMSLKEANQDLMTYETIWRDLVDLYPFVEVNEPKKSQANPSKQEVNQ